MIEIGAAEKSDVGCLFLIVDRLNRHVHGACTRTAATRQEVFPSPQTRKRHSALMEELLEKMEDLSLGFSFSTSCAES